jgi:acetyl esterase/lipase
MQRLERELQWKALGMDLKRRALLSGAMAFASARIAAAEIWGEPPSPAQGDLAAPIWPPAERIALWPNLAPGTPARVPTPSLTMNGPRGARELWARGIAQPQVNVYRAPRPNGSALLVLPGGGYEFLSVQNEGIDAAHRFAPFGTHVFVLTYRLPGEGWQNRDRVALQDAQRAMRLLRSRASQFSMDPERIGVIGFSAGGHLAADLITAFDEPAYPAVDEADLATARPRFAGLIYPVASLQPGAGHAGTRDNLLGANASSALVGQRSPTEHVRPDTPPCFVAHAMDDPSVPVESSLQMVAACRRANVPLEAHLFESGGHGFGFHAAPDAPVARWPDLFESWMHSHQAAGR